MQPHPKDPEDIVIHKNRGELCEKLEDILWAGKDAQHQNLRLTVILDDGAHATLIERHTGTGAYWKNMSTEIMLGEGARLNHIRIQDDDRRAVQTNMVHIRMERDAHLNSFSLNTGGRLTRHDIHAVLNGPGAACRLSGVNLLRGTQHGDTTIVIEHAAPHCMSNQFYRTILDDAATGVFQGKVHVHKEAQKTDGYQLSDALLLSPKATMNTKPELEIYADDVKCSHGATTAQPDEEPLFYLRSRGLTEDAARMMLIRAFVDEVTAHIIDDTIRARIDDKIESWLQTV